MFRSTSSKICNYFFILKIVSCSCPLGYNGPFCELITKSFEGHGFMWLPSISTCKDMHISLQIMPRLRNRVHFSDSKISKEKSTKNQSKNDDYCLEESCGSLILYQGELTESLSKAGLFSLLMKIEQDQIVVHLKAQHSEDTFELKVDSSHLYDGFWHHLDLFINDQVQNYKLKIFEKMVYKDLMLNMRFERL